MLFHNNSEGSPSKQHFFQLALNITSPFTTYRTNKAVVEHAGSGCSKFYKIRPEVLWEELSNKTLMMGQQSPRGPTMIMIQLSVSYFLSPFLFYGGLGAIVRCCLIFNVSLFLKLACARCEICSSGLCSGFLAGLLQLCYVLCCNNKGVSESFFFLVSQL